MRETTRAEKFHNLEDQLRSLRAIAVAFSGGLDSRFLSYTALRAGVEIQAYHVAGPHIPAQESAWAKVWAKKNGLPLTILTIDPLQIPMVAANTLVRCYHCKYAIFHALKKETKGAALCDGTNGTDNGGYRPGLRAIGELGIISPLALAGLEKTDIRALARQTGMDRPDQPARPCLLTRFNYGIQPTYAALAALDAAEGAVEEVLRKHALFAAHAGSADSEGETVSFRLRFEKEKQAVLHLAQTDLTPEARQDLLRALEANGFGGTPVVRTDRISGYFDQQRSRR